MVRNSGEIDGKRFDVAILGGGLGGLQCGYILAKNGLNSESISNKLNEYIGE